MSRTFTTISLSDKEFLTLAARSGTQGLITVATLAAELQASPRAVGLRFTSLEGKGWVRRVKKGWYFVLPLEATKTAGGVASDPWVMGAVLFAPCYIGGWSAAEHWELTEQLFRSTFIVTSANIRASRQTILGNEYRIVRVPARRIDGIATIWRGSAKVQVASRERTLADALANPAWVGGFRHLADMLATYLEIPERNDVALLKTMQVLHRGAAYKRLGYLLERLAPESKKLLTAMQRGVTTGTIKLDPAVAAKGKLDTAWGVWVNSTLGTADER